MDFTEARTWLWTATLLYAVAFVGGSLLARKGAGYPSFLLLIFVGLGFFLQTRGLYFRGLETHACPLGNGMERIQFIAWSFVLTYLIIRLVFKLQLLGLFTAGLALLLSLVSLLPSGMDGHYWEAPDYEKLFASPWIELHASVAIFSYGVFALLAVVSAMYLVQHSALRNRKTSTIASFLPSISQLEAAAEKLLLTGVVFLTVSIAVGSIHWAKDFGNVALPKLVVTIGVWVLYVVLWSLHRMRRLYAKKFARACLVAFLLAMVSMGTVSGKGKPGKGSQASDVDPVIRITKTQVYLSLRWLTRNSLGM
jgi:HemX protein